MNLSDITLVVGVDARHLAELRWVWPTWMRFKPELRQMPMILFYDPQEINPDDADFVKEHPNVRWYPWRMPLARSQREKMISGFVHVPSREVKTTWYLKLDTDVVATGAGVWIKPDWFEPDDAGRQVVLIAASWPYSKPRYVIDLFDDWADNVAQLAAAPRLNLPYSSESRLVRHHRIISWIFFGNTIWTRQMAGLIDSSERLPYPSQDTFMFYCAARTNAHMVREKMNRYHWSHKNLKNIKRLVLEMGMQPARANGTVRNSRKP